MVCPEGCWFTVAFTHINFNLQGITSVYGKDEGWFCEGVWGSQNKGPRSLQWSSPTPEIGNILTHPCMGFNHYKAQGEGNREPKHA